jgi:hypothetical protein
MDINDLGRSLSSGVVIKIAPIVLKSMMGKYLGSVKFKEMIVWVNEDRSLWQNMDKQYRVLLQEYGPKLGPMDWLTCEWIIESGRESAPSLCSLFTGDPQCRAWLERQVADIKINIKGVPAQ